jgi:hypothetical protein
MLATVRLSILRRLLSKNAEIKMHRTVSVCSDGTWPHALRGGGHRFTVFESGVLRGVSVANGGEGTGGTTSSCTKCYQDDETGGARYAQRAVTCAQSVC